MDELELKLIGLLLLLSGFVMVLYAVFAFLRRERLSYGPWTWGQARVSEKANKFFTSEGCGRFNNKIHSNDFRQFKIFLEILPSNGLVVMRSDVLFHQLKQNQIVDVEFREVFQTIGSQKVLKCLEINKIKLDQEEISVQETACRD